MKADRVLHKLLKKACQSMHKMRRAALASNVMALLHGTRLTVTDLGRSIQRNTQQKHRIKCADRLLSNARLHGERHDVYASVISLLIGTRTRPIIVVDWSDMDARKRHFLLRASIPVQGRSLTLYEEIHTLAYKEKPKTHAHFLQQLKAMLPNPCCPIIVSDAGFRVPWFKQVRTLGWDWIGRVRNRTLVKLSQEAVWKPCKALYEEATQTPKALGVAQMARRNPMDCQLIVYQAKPKKRIHKNRLGKKSRGSYSRKHAMSAKEPWLLATSLPADSSLANKVVKAYALRMQIEEAFRDVKSMRFGLGLALHVSYQVKRLEIMLLVAHLALVVAWLLGRATQLTAQHYGYQANTVKDRLVLSTLFIGLKVIQDTYTKLYAADIAAAWQSLNDIIQSHCEFEGI